MSCTMTLSHEHADASLLDTEAWDSPGRLTDQDLFAEASPGWRRSAAHLDDPEDDR
jgi:hypothetical protein